MNNGELKVKLEELSHRRDLGGQLQGFINDATKRINRRFGTDYDDMLGEGDSNTVLAHYHDLYVYEAMRQLSIHIRDWEEAQQFDALFVAEAQRQNITSLSTTEWPLDPLAIYSEEELANA